MWPRTPRTCRLATLGGKVNQCETQELHDALCADGYGDAAPDQPAGLCVVNTCTVTARSDQKCRQVIRRLVRESPGAKVLVLGCYAVRAPERCTPADRRPGCGACWTGWLGCLRSSAFG